MCGSCKETKKIATDPAEIAAGAPRLTSLMFCVVCVSMAHRKSADVFAIREVNGNRYTGTTIWSQSDGYSARERRLESDDYCSQRASQRSSQRSTQKISIS